MKHFHALPLTPNGVLTETVDALGGVSFLVSYGTTAKGQLEIVEPIAEELTLDNGAFSAWTAMVDAGFSEKEIDACVHAPTYWHDYYAWVEDYLSRPTTLAIIPDVIGGSSQVQDALLKEWPFPRNKGIPVFHIHLPIERCIRLLDEYPIVALGSSGEFFEIGTDAWHDRMHRIFDETCTSQFVPTFHGLRMMGVRGYPFARVDSSNVGQNHHRGRRKSCQSQADLIALERHPARTAIDMIRRINIYQGPRAWEPEHETKELFA